MKLFGRTGGHWLFWCGFIYLFGGMAVAFSSYRQYTILVEMVWLVSISLPLLCNPLARWLNMKETHMFDFFKKKPSNVVQFPEQTPKMPQIEPPKKEEPAKIFYRLGLTDNNRVAFSMGYSEITMNKGGCQQMIDQLIFFQSQLYDEDNSPNDDPDGGEPVPVPEAEQKAA